MGSRIVSGNAGATPAAKGGGVRIDDHLVAAPASGAVPLDETRVAYARKVEQPDTWDLRAHDGLSETDLDPNKVEGATTIYGGGGHWAAQTGDGPIRSDAHPLLPIAGLLGMGPDGTLAYRRSYHAGLGLVLRAVDGTTTELVPQTAVVRDVQVLSATAAVWTQGGRVKATGGDPEIPEGTCGSPRVVTLKGERWLLCFLKDAAGECVIVKPWSGWHGYVLTYEGKRDTRGALWPAYRPDLRVTEDGHLEACWSLTEGEGPGNIRSERIDPASPMVDLRRTAPVIVQPFAEPTLIGCFFGRESRYGVDPTAPGDCQVVVDSGIKTTGPVIIARVSDQGADLIAEYRREWARVHAVYVAEEAAPVSQAKTEAAIGKARARMRELGLPQRPVLTYTGDRIWPGLSADWHGLQCYPNPGESVRDAEHRWRNGLQALMGKTVVIIGGAYDRNRTIDAATLEACQPRLIELARGRKGLLFFSWRRAGGASEYPGVAAWLHAAAKAATLPAVETIVKPPSKPAPKPPTPKPPAPKPPEGNMLERVGYDEYLAGVDRIEARYREVHGREPAPKDVAMFIYRWAQGGADRRWPSLEAVLESVGK